MNSMNLTPVTTGTSIGIPTQGSWLMCDSAAPVSYQGTAFASAHLPFVGVVPATVSAVETGRVAGTDAARKRGRPPRGIPR